jgi:MSHA pilin protein MshA
VYEHFTSIRRSYLEKVSRFTLIELIIVIVILGILATTVAPKFINLASDAKRANRSALLGSIKSAMGLAHIKCITDSGYEMNGDCAKEVAGNTIRMDNGYPSTNHFLSSSSAGLVDSGDWEVKSFGGIQRLQWVKVTARLNIGG